MSHRAKHRRRNWTPERLTKAAERAERESVRPAPAPRERVRRALAVSTFLRLR